MCKQFVNFVVYKNKNVLFKFKRKTLIVLNVYLINNIILTVCIIFWIMLRILWYFNLIKNTKRIKYEFKKKLKQ